MQAHIQQLDECSMEAISNCSAGPLLLEQQRRTSEPNFALTSTLRQQSAISLSMTCTLHTYSTYTVHMYETIWSLLWTVRKLQVSWLNKAIFDAVRLYIKYWRTHPFHVTWWIMATVQWGPSTENPSDECKASADLIHHSSWPVKTMTPESMIVGKKGGTKEEHP